jgi:hypothetical protein
MEIIVTIKYIVYSILAIFIAVYKNIKNMSKIIKWFKSLFTKKQVKNEKESVKSSAIPNPDGTPTKRPK